MNDQSGPAQRGKAWARLEEFSRLAGPVEQPPVGPYRVRFRGIWRAAGNKRALGGLLLAVLNMVFAGVFFVWLVQPDHFAASRPDQPSGFVRAADLFVVCSIALIELMRLINVVSLSVASLTARDPIPVAPDRGLRVAFLTTIVPSKEPIAVVRETLIAAQRIRHAGMIDLWLLDEGDDPEVKRVCRQLGVKHFTRKDIAAYNQPKGPYRARTKHGNYNAWIDAYGHNYDVLLSVDPDHVPLANFAERILGYFRDPDVAYVVGPQCYKNGDTFVTRGAESQQFPFHSVVQRAANRYHAAMLVGTNNAMRISALRSIGGLADSITEDMATGLAMHTSRNPETGRRWKSVYTPDVLAAGEGPSSWSDYFSQQRRWSRGTFEILLKTFWHRIWRLSPGKFLHYGLIVTFYPSMAIGWLLGFINAALFLVLSVAGITVAPTIWLALYVDATAFSLWLYVANRRYNVSPFEAPNSRGLTGMVMSVISAPIYAAMLIGTLLRRPARFVVTPKGSSSSSDGLRTFRNHLGWAVVLSVTLIAAVLRGYPNPATMLWPTVALIVCLTPVLLWRADVRRLARERPPVQQFGTPEHAGDITMEHPLAALRLPRD